MKNKIIKLYEASWFTLFIVLPLILTSEWLWFHRIKGCQICSVFELYDVSIDLLLVISSVVLTILVVGGFMCKTYTFSIELVKSFINNALGSKWRSLFFILLFLVHISWLSDTCLDYFIKSEGGWIEILICLIGICLLFIVFPIEKIQKKSENKNNRTLLITGISRISAFSIQGFLKPLCRYPNINKIVILSSSSAFSFDDKKHEEAIFSYIETLPDDIKKILKESYMLDLPLEEKKKYLSLFIKNRIKTIEAYKDKNVDVYFSNPVSYDNFEDCYKIMKELLYKHEKGKTFETIINTSPGTAAVSGVMTIYAIKQNRLLTYTTQTNPTIIPVTLDVWTIKDNLLEFSREIETEQITSK